MPILTCQLPDYFQIWGTKKANVREYKSEGLNGSPMLD
jgi:hypothetical protein